MYLKITREKLSHWLAGLKAQAEVLAPVKVKGLWTFQKFDSQEIPRKFQNSLLPPKGLFLESLRALFEWKSPGGSPQVNPLPPLDGQRVIFGLKPCDARALRIIEPVFTGEYRDVFYLRNLSRTLLLGLACRAQCEGSFCGEMGIDSQDSADFDIFFREVPEGYVARVITSQGKGLAGGRDFFEEASEKEWNLAQAEKRGRREPSLFDLERVKAGVAEFFPDENFWKRISAKCINCGICTYLCPTCHCFDLCDLQLPRQGARFRCGDSCAFPDFTKMAVHNPREEKWRRYRQRVSHKFNFFYQNFQRIACVGCGRCVTHCPVNLDLREVLLEVAR
ncbi:MAG: 4Fe-4S dicluster domain-containing protein [Thermodesulfobacteriota bacterium]|jgi:ferredoxin